MLATLLLLSRLPWADEVDWPTCRTNVRKEEEIVTPMNLRLIHFAFQSCSLNLENEAMFDSLQGGERQRMTPPIEKHKRTGVEITVQDVLVVNVFQSQQRRNTRSSGMD